MQDDHPKHDFDERAICRRCDITEHEFLHRETPCVKFVYVTWGDIAMGFLRKVPVRVVFMAACLLVGIGCIFLGNYARYEMGPEWIADSTVAFSVIIGILSVLCFLGTAASYLEAP